MEYDAFISYSTHGDGEVARSLQTGLERLVKPWYRRRPFLRIFRDETSLPPGADLGELIERRLDQSGHLVVLLSPESATSRWVDMEIEHWVATSGPDTIVPVITSFAPGAMVDLSEFDWTGADVPEQLRGQLAEPLYVDMRWARGSDELDLSNPRFERNVAQVAAAIREQGPDEFIGALVAMRARARILTGTIGLAVGILIVAVAFIALGLLAARAEISSARNELDEINAQLDEQRSALRVADAELLASKRELANAQLAVQQATDDLAATQLRLDQAEDDLAATEGDLAATEADLEAARRDVSAAVDARDAAIAAQEAAEDDLRAAQAERDQVQRELQALEEERNALLAERDAAAAARDQAIRERDAIALTAEAVALAVDSGVANANGDAALGLALAVESAATLDVPPAASYTALVAAREALATNSWQTVGTHSSTVALSSDSSDVLPLTLDTAPVAARSNATTGELLMLLQNGTVQIVAPGTFTSRQIHASVPDCFGCDPTVWLADDASRFVVATGPHLSLRHGTTGAELAAVDLPQGHSVSGAAVNGARVAIQAEALDDVESWFSSHRELLIWDTASLDPPRLVARAASTDDVLLGGLTDAGQVVWAKISPVDQDGYETAVETRVMVDGVAIATADASVGTPECIRVNSSGTVISLSDSTGVVRLVDASTGQVTSGQPLRPFQQGLSALDRLVPECGAMTAMGEDGNVWTVTSDGVVRLTRRDGTESTDDTYRSRLQLDLAVFDRKRPLLYLFAQSGDILTVERRNVGSIVPALVVDRSTGVGGSVVVGSDARLIVCAYLDCTVYDAASGLREIEQVFTPVGVGVTAEMLVGDFLVFSDGGWWIAPVVSDASPVRTEIGAPLELPTPTAMLAGASEAERLAAVTGNVVTIHQLHADAPGQPTAVGTPIVSPMSSIESIGFSADGRRIAIAGDGRLEVHDTATGQQYMPADASAGTPLRLQLDRTGSIVLAVYDRDVTVWDVASGTIRANLSYDRPLQQVALSRDGRLLAADGGRVIWDVASGARVSGESVAMDSVTGVGFIGATHRLISTGTLRGRPVVAIWDTLDTGAACALARPFMQGRTVDAYLRTGRSASGCPPT
ncbi:MAG: TIR domain-containing protein [Ilumatobacteraceae bacterium]